jgi:hypothetical protein
MPSEVSAKADEDHAFSLLRGAFGAAKRERYVSFASARRLRQN